ncbi:MAG: hypothetical protein ABIG69_18790 [Bacteroidota bacterium]
MRIFLSSILIVSIIALTGCGKNPLLSLLPEGSSGNGGSARTTSAKVAYFAAKGSIPPSAFFNYMKGENILSDGFGDWTFIFYYSGPPYDQYGNSKNNEYIVKVYAGGNKNITNIDLGYGFIIADNIKYDWSKDSIDWIKDIAALDSNFINGIMQTPTGLSGTASNYWFIIESTLSSNKFKVQLYPTYLVTQE